MSKRPAITSEYCTRLVGRKVVAYHVNGHVYDGVLHAVSNDGIYLIQATLINPASSFTDDFSANHAISNTDEQADITEAFFPFLFLPLVALAGLAAARPYPYGYYPGPWY